VLSNERQHEAIFITQLQVPVESGPLLIFPNPLERPLESRPPKWRRLGEHANRTWKGIVEARSATSKRSLPRGGRRLDRASAARKRTGRSLQLVHQELRWGSESFVDHGQIIQLECLRSDIWGTKSQWGRVLMYQH
jgi:hypothetical protein